MERKEDKWVLENEFMSKNLRCWQCLFFKSKVKQFLCFLPDAARRLNIFQLHVDHLKIITKDKAFS